MLAKAASAVLGAIELTDTQLVKDSKAFSALVGKHVSFLDRVTNPEKPLLKNMLDRYAKLNASLENLRKGEDITDWRGELNRNMKGIAKVYSTLSERMRDYYNIDPSQPGFGKMMDRAWDELIPNKDGKPSTVTFRETFESKFMEKMSSIPDPKIRETALGLFYNAKELMEPDRNFYNIVTAHAYGALLKGSFFDGILQDSKGSLRLDIISHPAITVSDLVKVADEGAVKNLLMDKIGGVIKSDALYVTDKRIQRLIENMLGEPIFSTGGGKGTLAATLNAGTKIVQEARQVSTFFKYVLNAPSGTQMTLQSLIMGFVLNEARSKGLRVIKDHGLMDHLIRKEGVLRGESRVDFDVNTAEAPGESFLARLINITTNAVLGKDNYVSNLVKSVLKGGLHSIADVMMESEVKRTSIARALSQMGIMTVKEMDSLLEAFRNENGKSLSVEGKELLVRLRALAAAEYNDFFTNSGIHALSRDKLSRWIPFNYMQGYMVKRGDHALRPLRNLARAVDSGKVKTAKDVWRFAANDIAFRDLMYTAGVSFKYAVLMNTIMEANSNDDGDPSKYALLVNDFYQGLTQNYIARLLGSGPKGFLDYYEMKDTLHSPAKFSEGLSAATWSATNALIAQAFRELKPLNALVVGAKLTFEGKPMEYIFRSMQSEVEAAISGAGRFNALPGWEGNGGMKVPEMDDKFGYLVFGMQETNKSLQLAGKTARWEAILKGIDPKTGFLDYSGLSQLPVIPQLFMGQGTSKNRIQYETYVNAYENDKTFRNLLNGKMSPGLFTEKNTDSFWKELTNFDFTNDAHNKGLEVSKKYWSQDDINKFDLFMGELERKMKVTGLRAALDKTAGTGRDKELAILLQSMDEKANGSARMALSYIADRALVSARDEYNEANGIKRGTYLPPVEEANIKQALLEKLWPQMYTADKTSWWKLQMDYLKQNHPVEFDASMSEEGDKNIKGSSLWKKMNAVGTMDLAIVSEAKAGNASAAFIRNVSSEASKYVEDPVERMKILNYVLGRVGNLEATPTDKAAIRIGILAGNISHMADIAKDATVRSLYPQQLQKTLDTFYSAANASLIETGKRFAQTDGTYGGSSYSSGPRPTGTGSSPYPKSSSSGAASNRSVQAQLENAMPTLRKAWPEGYSPTLRSSTPVSRAGYSSYDPRPEAFRSSLPSISTDFKAFSPDLRAAVTRNLVHGYVAHNPQDVTKDLYKSSSYFSKPYAKALKTKLPKVEKRYLPRKYVFL